MNKKKTLRILVVEDVQSKFDDVLSVLSECIADFEYERASHLNGAEDLVMSERWDLVVLDLSMDITAAGSFDLNSGHATLGGLDVLERMSLLKLAMPTVLVTGFDSFQDPDRFDNSIMNIADLQQLAGKWLQSSYLGTVRYGSETWADDLIEILIGWRDR